MIQNSFESSPQIAQSTLAVRNIMKEIEGPYLAKIQQAKSNFISKRQEHAIQSAASTNKLPSRHIIRHPSLALISPFYPTEKNIDLPPRILTESSYEQQIETVKEPESKEWTLTETPSARFTKLEDMVQKYTLFFEEKVKFSKCRKYGGDSFKVEEKKVIEDIYQDVYNPDDRTVNFDAIQDFFQKCPLFYRVYNIHPDSLRDVLGDCAHHFPSKLTEQQFMNLFLLNNRTNEDYDSYNVEKVFRKCILEPKIWKEMKDIFEIFDTFGNETIQVRKFFHKLKVSPQYKSLLSREVIYFPNIKRHYTLGKILFELQNKLNIIDKQCEWEELKAMIQNFSHIEQPTIDLIEKNKIGNGVITPFSNSFMVSQKIIQHLKNIFQRCPKYCHNFVKVAQFCSEIHEAPQSKDLMLEVVRREPTVVAFKQVLVSIMSQPLAFLDLDQILQWFSIKGFDHTSHQQSVPKQALSLQSSSDDDEEFNRRRRTLQKERKCISNLPKRSARKENRPDVTVPQEFKLSKKSKVTIREKKVKLMLEEQREKERAELAKKFKANPIPASINSEKYQEYRAELEQNKIINLARLNAAKENDQLVLQYLQANTRLFEKPKKSQPAPIEEQYVKAEPAPWFVHIEMLGQIEAEKKERLKKARKENNYKYMKEWKNLPSFMFENNIESTPEIPKAGSYNLIVNNLSGTNISNGKQEQPEDVKHEKKTKKVPNFKELQMKFQCELEQKKKHYKPTVIQEFQLSSPRVKEHQNHHESLRKGAQSSRPAISAPKSSKQNFIGSTLKYESMVKSNYLKRAQERLEKQIQVDEQKLKQQQKKIFAKLVQKELKREMKKGLKSTRSTMRSKHSRGHSHQKNKEMADMYRRVFSRPFLFQSSRSKDRQLTTSQIKARPIDFRGSPLSSDQKQVEKLFPSEFIHEQDYDQYDNQLYEEQQEAKQIGSRRSI